MAEPTNILDVLMEYIEDVKEHFVPYALSGAGIGLIMMPYSILVVFIVYGAMFLGAMPGIAANDEDLMIMGMLVAPLIAVFGSVLLVNLITVPMHASLLRAIDTHQGGDREEGEPSELSFNATWSSFGEGPGRALVFIAIQLTGYALLVPFCILPGIAFLAATDMAWPLVVIEKKSPIEAIRRSIGHFQQHLSWHLGYVLILFSMGFVLAYIPFLGAFLTPGLVGGWRVWAYRSVRDDLLEMA